MMSKQTTKFSQNEFSFLKGRPVTRSLVSHLDVNLRDSFAERIELFRDKFEEEFRRLYIGFLKTRFDYQGVSRLPESYLPRVVRIAFQGFDKAPNKKSLVAADYWMASEKPGTTAWRDAYQVGDAKAAQVINGVSVAKSRSRKFNLREFDMWFDWGKAIPIPVSLGSKECADVFASRHEYNPLVRINAAVGTGSYTASLNNLVLDYRVMDREAPGIIEAWRGFRDSVDPILVEKKAALDALQNVVTPGGRMRDLFTDNPELWVFVDSDLKDALLEGARTVANKKPGVGGSNRDALKGAALRKLITA